MHFTSLAQAVCVASWLGSALGIPQHAVRGSSLQQRDIAAIGPLHERGSGPSPGIGHGGVGKPPALQERSSGPSPGIGHGGVGKPPARR